MVTLGGTGVQLVTLRVTRLQSVTLGDTRIQSVTLGGPGIQLVTLGVLRSRTKCSLSHQQKQKGIYMNKLLRDSCHHAGFLSLLC